MKGIVIYYSATGNTSKIAKSIYKGMNSVINCDISSIKKADPKSIEKYDVIAIGSPIWYYRETANTRLFIYNMPDLTGKLCVPFCVHGASPAGFFWSIVPALLNKGLTIIGYNNWYGSVYQVLHAPKPYMTDGHPDDVALKEAEDFGIKMAERAVRISKGEKDLIPELPKGGNAGPLWKNHGAFKNFPPMKDDKDTTKNRPVFSTSRPERTIDISKCKYPECTMCADTCPMSAIDLTKKPGVFKKSCINCSLCDKMCPEMAIDVDAETMNNRTHRIINMEKCKYPECTLCIDQCPMNSIDFSVNPPVVKKNCEGDDLCWTICPTGAIEITNLESTHLRLVPDKNHIEDHPFVKFLDEAEKEGKFRRHVPLDKVGWDNPVYKNPKTPRFVVEEE